MWWFGGNWYFHAKFRPFWSVGIMTKNYFRPSFFNFFFVFISQNDHYQPKRTFCGDFEGNRSINGRDLVIFMPHFSRFWSMGIMTKSAFRPSFFKFFFASISQNGYYQPKRTLCGGLEEISP